MKNIWNEIEKRILVLDGAMGTMLQAYKFTEEDFRGDRFRLWIAGAIEFHTHDKLWADDRHRHACRPRRQPVALTSDGIGFQTEDCSLKTSHETTIYFTGM